MIKKENLEKTSAWPFVEAKKMLRERKSIILKKKEKLLFKQVMDPVVYLISVLSEKLREHP